MDQAYSEAANRALTQAEQLVRLVEATEVDTGHLLWALFSDESRAAEALAAAGLTRQHLQDCCPVPDDWQQQSSALPHDGPPVALSETLGRVIDEARGYVASISRHGEIGSEHMLWALAKVNSPVAELLRSCNLDSNEVSARAEINAGFANEPIAVDFEIRREFRSQTDSTDTLRIIDAAANRAREGLRVLEDFVRFTLDDAHLTGLLKNCRHELAQALAGVDPAHLLQSRDTVGDVGTSIATAAESVRGAPIDVVRANFKRVQEAARTLEEFGKIVSPEVGVAFERMRYGLYTLEKAVLLTEHNRRRLEGRNVYLLVTESLCHHGSGPAIREALAAGIGIVQVREKSMPDRKLLDYAKYVREWTREAGALFVVNDRPDLAVLAAADGVHVGQDELTVREARRILGPDRLVGVSTHTIGQARRAVLDGADYLGVGPVFASTTKTFEQLAGLELVRQLAEEITLPWFSIGGIDADNVGKVIAAGASRIAVSGAICAAENPRAAASALLEATRGGREGASRRGGEGATK